MKQSTILLFLLICRFSFAQTDTSYLPFEQLKIEDFEDFQEEKQKIGSASRSQLEIENIPFSTHVIYKDEIKENGYVTLVDALKTVPGIRVSQPGSSLEGETFLMRGLRGNQNAKILINDIPIKPTFLLGMPIGAQLPIKQAERIEIVFGPSSALYGSDASAGIINIIMREPDQPIFVNADLSFGSENFRSLNLLIGGELGKERAKIQYSIFGGNTQFDDRKIFYNLEENHNPFNYISDSLRETFIRLFSKEDVLNNYEYGKGIIFPKIGNFPHSSRLFGVNIKWQDFNLSYESMYRKDHSALGFSPHSNSISNPNNLTGESINRLYFSWERDFKKWYFQTFANFLYSTSDKASSNNYVLTNLNRAIFDEAYYRRGGEVDSVLVDGGWPYWESRLFGGTRYNSTSTLGFRFEQISSYKWNKNLETSIIFNVYYESGEFSNYALEPVENSISTLYELDYGFGFNFNEGLSFYNFQQGYGIVLQAIYSKNNFNLIGKNRITYGETRSNGKFTFLRFFPRIGLNYKVSKRTRLRINYGQGFRSVSPYYFYNSDIVSRSTLFWQYDIGELESKPEKNKTLEFGLTSEIEHLNFEAIFFHSSNQNELQYFYEPSGFGFESLVRTYFDNSNNTTTINGFQINLKAKSLIPSVKFTSSLYLQLLLGESIRKGTSIGAIRNQPKLSSQLKNSINITPKVRLNLLHIYHSSSLNLGLNRREIPGYYTLDGIINANITDNLQLKFKAINIFNKKHYGLEATGTLEDLMINPQSLRQFFIGINYEL